MTWTRCLAAAVLTALLALPAPPALAADGAGAILPDFWQSFTAWWQGLTSWVAAAETTEEPEPAPDADDTGPLPDPATQSQSEEDEGPKIDPLG